MIVKIVNVILLYSILEYIMWGFVFLLKQKWVYFFIFFKYKKKVCIHHEFMIHVIESIKF